MWLDTDFPKMLGVELHRPHPTYVSELAIEPVVVHDFSKMPGQTVQLDRYSYWGSPGTKESRERTADQVIGTASGRSITKQKVNVTLKEYTGPADPDDPESPSTFKVSRQNLLTAQRLLLDTGSVGVFHQSIGSLTLLDDYRRWRDRVFLNELYKAFSRGKATDEQGGYYFPMGLTQTELNYATGSLGYTVTAANPDSAKFSVKRDLLAVVKDMSQRNTPRFPDGFYRCLCDPGFMMHMRQDKDFREISRYSGLGQVSPLAPHLQPNANLYLGIGPAYGGSGSVGGAPAMPSGFVFEGVRFFESTNFPEYSYNVSINGGLGFSTTTAKSTRAYTGHFYGLQCLGIGIGGQNAQVSINSNDDFSRYVILIWTLYAGFEVLNYDFITVAHSFDYAVAGV